MRRTIAIVTAGLLGLAGPAFAQSPGAQSGNQTAQSGGQDSSVVNGPYDQQVAGTQNLDDVYAQAPGGPPNPFSNPSTFLIIGGIAGGAGLIAYAVSQNQSNNPVSP
jgi:hypothetical protein